ncbi:protein disulfide oxidoreductase [Idiomarina loihiensis]|jgi:thiol-disulfide isomerase/thioredoxin|uniref:protein disulfide oxidoreductase n=1 Tax=Idiomarina TaxID=135575 RepID=UPI00257D3DFC|nr:MULTISPECIES: protein disulfide oxidoreductase [unclassified Idiomarina]|tara:strand:- start:25566 stop:26096 length:531 start_codon:yes stop_codon:yes gene_type:complete
MLVSNNKAKTSWTKRLRTAALYIVLFSVVAFVVDSFRNSDVPESVPAELSSLTDINGEQYNLREMSKDSPVVLYFWATWCPVCPAVSPTVDYVGNHYPTISVALRSGNNDKLKHYAQAKGYEFPIVNDNLNRVSNGWQVSATPTIIIIENGDIVSATAGVTTPPGLFIRLWFHQFF